MGIQAAGRFICQHHCWMIDESTGHRHTLLLTSLQLIRLVGGPFGKPHEFKNFRSRLLGFLLSSSEMCIRDSYLEECGFKDVVLVGELFAATRHSYQSYPDVTALIAELQREKPCLLYTSRCV